MIKVLALIVSITIIGQAIALDIKPTTLELTITKTKETAPDIALITASVITENSSIQKARSENANRMDQAITKLKELKIPMQDIQTSSLRISPQYSYQNNQPPKIKSYNAEHTLSIKVRDLDLLSKIFDQLTSSGINQIAGPSFILSSTSILENQARNDAIAEAQTIAQTYAKSTGLKNIEIVAIKELNAQTPQPQMMAMESFRTAKMMDADTQVMNGQVSVSITINILFALK